MEFPTDKFVQFAKQHTVPAYVKTASTREFDNLSDPRTRAAVYFAKFAELTGTPAIPVSELRKRAQILTISEDTDQLADQYAEFNAAANGYIDTPDGAVFAHTHKTAEEIEQYAYKMADGNIYDVRDFDHINVGDVLDVFGEKFAMAMCDGLTVSHTKAAEVCDVMTELELTLFKDLLKQANIQPKYVVRPTVSLKDLAVEMKRLGV